MKVEDRLIKIGEIWKEKKDCRLKSLIEEVNKSANHPSINNYRSDSKERLGKHIKA